MTTVLNNDASTQSRNDPGPETKTPAHQAVYRRLHDAILFGDLAPGQPITIQGLTEQLDAGMTPVREAIRRLTAEGALVMQGNRRASVPVLDAKTLEQLEFMRLHLEPELAFRATARITMAEIAGLTDSDAALNRAIDTGDVGAYLRHNHAFHSAIYASADAPVLAQAAGGLWLRFGPSLRVVCGRSGTANLPDKHADLLDALRARDADAARTAMTQDIDQGMRQIRETLVKDPQSV